jgi:hypothetical protein
MQDFIPKFSLKRRRLIPRRPHPNLEFLLRRRQNQLGLDLGLYRSDDSVGLDGTGNQVLSWIGSDFVPLSPENAGGIPASQTAVVRMVGLLPR